MSRDRKSDTALRYLEAVILSSDDAIVTNDLDGRITSWNPAAEKLYGYKAEEVMWRREELIVPDERRDEEREFLSKLRRGETIDHVATMRRSKSGVLLDVELTMSPIRDRDGTILGSSSIARDISERRRAEATARYLEAIIRSSDDPIIATDLEGRITSWNPAAQRLYGYRSEEVSGQAVELLVPKDRRASHAEFLEAIRRGEPVDHVETVRRAKGGQLIDVELTISPIRDHQGHVIGASAIERDIRGRKEVYRLKDEFVSIVSHELRTPLTSIRGALGLLAEGVARDEAQRTSLIDVAFRNCTRLVRLVNDILDVQRIEAGRMEFKISPVDLPALVEDAVAAHVGYASECRVDLRFEPEVKNGAILADSDRVMQVMANLISNACKFSGEGTLITVVVASTPDKIRVEVRDQGPGIPQDQRHRVFEKFSQLDSTSTRKIGGSGLGLSIAKAIVEHLDGSIGFDARKGGGTTFHVEWPLWAPGAEACAPKSEGPAMRKRILVCEDDRHVALSIRAILEDEGFDVDVAYSAELARELLAQRDYALMTLDLGLPDMNGLRLLEELRERPDTADMPVVVVSAGAEEARLGGEGLAVSEWLQKPLDPSRLLDVLAKTTAGPEGHRPRILHVEDDEDVLQIVESMVREIGTVEAARTVAEAKLRLEQSDFDLVLLDLSLADGWGWQLIPLIRKKPRNTPILVFSAFDVVPEVDRYIAGSMVKSRISKEELLARIGAVLNRARSIPAKNSVVESITPTR